MAFLKIVALSIVSAVVFGVVHDMVTAHICLEYFTIGHVRLFKSDIPALHALGWGVIATWWMGAALGVLVGSVARIGRWPRLGAADLIRPISLVLLLMGGASFITGAVTFLIASNDWVAMIGPMADRLDPAIHDRFLTDLAAHNAAYFSGVLGGFGLCVWVICVRFRRKKNSLGDVIDPVLSD